ncbi:MAG: dienelactone hydrolase family protein [Trueperaceae bacterium]|nr:dienelactone hydrolase family protein [Trueperaceae bacterium]
MRILRRTLLAAAALVAASAVALALSVVVDRARTDGRVEALTNVVYDATDGGPDVAAHRAEPPGDGPHPAVVMIHEFWGLRADVTGKADALAERGYVVVAPDTFRGVSVDLVPSAIWNVVATPAAAIDRDLRVVVDALAADPSVDPERIVVMGFCYGGGAALRYALSDDRLAGTGVFYGTPIDDPARLARLPGPVLGIFGEEDAQIPPREVAAFDAALDEAGVPHAIRSWPGVGHAFVGGVDAIAAGGPAGEAWATFVTWLEDVLGAPAPDAAGGA